MQAGGRTGILRSFGCLVSSAWYGTTLKVQSGAPAGYGRTPPPSSAPSIYY